MVYENLHMSSYAVMVNIHKTGFPLEVVSESVRLISVSNDEALPLQVERDESIIKLNLGGEKAKRGWYIVNGLDSIGDADIIADIGHLDMFANNSVGVIYASKRGNSYFSSINGNTSYIGHVFEHVSYKVEASAVLTEWSRILKPGNNNNLSFQPSYHPLW